VRGDQVQHRRMTDDRAPQRHEPQLRLSATPCALSAHGAGEGVPWLKDAGSNAARASRSCVGSTTWRCPPPPPLRSASCCANALNSASRPAVTALPCARGGHSGCVRRPARSGGLQPRDKHSVRKPDTQPLLRPRAARASRCSSCSPASPADYAGPQRAHCSACGHRSSTPARQRQARLGGWARQGRAGRRTASASRGRRSRPSRNAAQCHRHCTTTFKKQLYSPASFCRPGTAVGAAPGSSGRGGARAAPSG